MANISDLGKELSAMDLNNIKLDLKHTVLTPEYLDGLITEGKKSVGQKIE